MVNGPTALRPCYGRANRVSRVLAQDGDNAPAESFFSTIKTECLHRQSLKTRPATHLTIVQYIHWYNATRRHSTNGQVSPVNSEASFLPQPAA